MSEQPKTLARVVWFLKSFRSWIIYGLPAAVALLWILRLSETFTINIFALKSAIFVYALVWVITAIAHTVITVLLEHRVKAANVEDRVPNAIVRRLDIDDE